MVSTRRKSVSFAGAGDDPLPRTRGSSTVDCFERSTAEPPAKKQAVSKAGTKKKVEADGHFKFKRSKKSAAAPVPAETIDEDSTDILPAQVVPALAPLGTQATTEKPIDEGGRTKPAPSGGDVAGTHTCGPIAPTLDGAPLAVLYALLEECSERAKAHQPSGNAAPSKIELALSMCMNELERQGVTQVPPISSESIELRMRQAVLEQRLEEVVAAKRNWEAAAAASAASSSALDALAARDAQPNAQVLEQLPPLPNIAGQLRELGGLAMLCADQLAGAVHRASHVTKQHVEDQQKLAQASHSVAFQDCLDVRQPKKLILSVAS